jgi:hypothetical protein
MPSTDDEFKQWAVIAIDWQAPNVLSWWDCEEQADKVAARFDSLALRAVAVPKGHPLIREVDDAEGETDPPRS